ncbi:hypothetical protein [Bdellovibrio sp. HCB337]|uniref:hypothetical protein n=1 Tax=Bdellovibrio sp. HCB337 TaxID=3394358 RepID=UPI0039A567B4
MKTLFLILILSSAAMAEEELSVPTDATSSGGVTYWIAKKLVLDIDKMLVSQGIRAEVCTYRNFNPSQETSYKGIGPCLYENFKKSMKSDELTGVTFTWIQDKNQNYHPIEIRWRPPRGGWMKVIGQALEMRLEKPLYSVRSFFGGDEKANKLRYSDFLAGELNIILPKDPAALEALLASGNQWLKKFGPNLRDIDFGLKTDRVEEGKVIYQGHLTVGLDLGGEYQQTNFDVTTNVNVLLLDRKFFAKGHMDSNGGLP